MSALRLRYSSLALPSTSFRFQERQSSHRPRALFALIWLGQAKSRFMDCSTIHTGTHRETDAPHITLYDIPSRMHNTPWSPSTWKARYALHVKYLPYKTIWVEYPDIADLYIKNGVPPVVHHATKSPRYTLPMIHDSSKSTFVYDSSVIAKYLDKTYPDSPPLFPKGLDVLINAFREALRPKFAPLLPFIIPAEWKILNPRSQEFFRRTREEEFGKRLEDIAPQSATERELEWRKLEKALGGILRWSDSNSQRRYITGDHPIFADIILASYFIWMRNIFGKDSEEWAMISSWHDGRWEELLGHMKQYETVV